jgi:hypothetical protein
MMLAALLKIPHRNEDWSEFSWHHRLSHDRIRQAIKAKYGYDLTDYQIDPMEPQAMQQFLQNNSQLHSAMNATLHLPGIDLLDAKLDQENTLVSWINRHWQEHFYAEAALGIGS